METFKQVAMIFDVTVKVFSVAVVATLVAQDIIKHLKAKTFWKHVLRPRQLRAEPTTQAAAEARFRAATCSADVKLETDVTSSAQLWPLPPKIALIPLHKYANRPTLMHRRLRTHLFPQQTPHDYLLTYLQSRRDLYLLQRNRHPSLTLSPSATVELEI